MFALLVASAVAAPLGPGIPIKVVVPPPEVLDGVSTLSVEPLTGPNGEAIAIEIEEALTDAERVVEAPGMASIGQGLLSTATETGAAAAASAVGGGLQGKLVGGITRAAGAMVAEELEVEPLVLDDGLTVAVFELVDSGADATLGGAIEVAEHKSTYKTEVPKTDSDGNVIKDSDGNTVMVEIPCAKREVTVSVRWQVDKGGDTVVQKVDGRTASDARCGEDRSNLATKDALAAPLLGGWGPAVANQIAPGWALRRVPMIRDKTQKEELKLTRSDALMPAACGMRGLVAFDADDFEAVYNLGALLEGMGHYDAASQQYQHALALKSKKRVATAIDRVMQRTAEVQTLTEAYGVDYAIGEPDYSACPPLPEGRRTYVKKPATLYASAEATDAVGELPKKLKVFVTEELGDMVHVETVDGRQGYLEAKRVK